MEQEQIFEAMWFCAVRSGDLDKPGAFKTVQVGRESVLITRSRSGEVRAFFNVCRHRGAQLCTEESGEVKRAFQCPYHAWTYDLDGKLIAAPNLTKMPDIDRVEYGLRTHRGPGVARLRVGLPGRRTAVVRGHRAARTSVDRLGDVESIDHYDIAHLSVGRRIVYDVKANWKLIIENFMECYHCATIHPELTEVLPEFADGLRRPVLRGARRRVRRGRRGIHRRRLRGSRPHPGRRPRTRTAATTRSRSSRRCSSTWCPTT